MATNYMVKTIPVDHRSYLRESFKGFIALFEATGKCQLGHLVESGSCVEKFVPSHLQQAHVTSKSIYHYNALAQQVLRY